MGMRGLSVAALVAATSLSGCASILGRSSAQQSVAMAPSDGVPAAMGQVDVRKEPNGNTRVDVSVKHLAPPERIAPNATNYVVWMKPIKGDEPPQNAGALTIDKNLKGKLRTVTPLKSFDVFITAEQTT